jgi:hypothetical protein
MHYAYMFSAGNCGFISYLVVATDAVNSALTFLCVTSTVCGYLWMCSPGKNFDVIKNPQGDKQELCPGNEEEPISQFVRSECSRNLG